MSQAVNSNFIQGPPLAVVAPASAWVPLDLRELWRFRELLLTLGFRDLKLRYRQTFLGVTWVILQPLLGAGLLSFVFGTLGGLPSDGVPYFLSAFAGMMAWNAFQTTLTKSSVCLIGNSHLVSKVYFPRIALPLSTIMAAIIDFCVSVPVFIILLICYQGHHFADGSVYHFHVTWQLLLTPVWLVMLLSLAQGIGLFCSALTVQYRDVQYIVPVMANFLMYASPVAYSVTVIFTRLAKHPFYKQLYFMNPISGLIAGFRWSLLGNEQIRWVYFAYAIGVTLLILVAGAYSFRRMEQRFADVI